MSFVPGARLLIGSRFFPSLAHQIARGASNLSVGSVSLKAQLQVVAPHFASYYPALQPISFTETLIPFSQRGQLTFHKLNGLQQIAETPYVHKDLLFPLPGYSAPSSSSTDLSEEMVIGDAEVTDVPHFEMISTLKRRKLKMNKHKHKKRLKKTRALRKRLGKIK